MHAHAVRVLFLSTAWNPSRARPREQMRIQPALDWQTRLSLGLVRVHILHVLHIRLLAPHFTCGPDGHQLFQCYHGPDALLLSLLYPQPRTTYLLTGFASWFAALWLECTLFFDFPSIDSDRQHRALTNMFSFSTFLWASVVALCGAQSTFDPLRPPALPLAVKSPYLSTWQQAGSEGGNGGYLPGQWPTFWSGQVVGWEGFIRVDNKTYQWMGFSDQIDVYVEQIAYQYTSTRSIFTLNIDEHVQMNVTFLSPVTPNDMMRMSLPYSYMNVEVGSLDGESHAVQIYTDISAEWVSGDRTANAEWDYGVAQIGVQPSANNARVSTHNFRPSGTPKLGTQTVQPLTHETAVQYTWHPYSGYGQGYKPTKFAHPPQQTDSAGNVKRQSTNATGGVAYHKIWKQQQLELNEFNQQADWGYWYYSTNNADSLTHQSGADRVVRQQFIDNGKLANTEDTNFRPIEDDFPVFGFAVDMGQISGPVCEGKSTLFMISLHQENCIDFEGAGGNATLPCMWNSYFGSETDAVSFFYSDFDHITGETKTFDGQVQQDSVAAGGQDYASLTTISVRQAFGALAYANTPDDPLVFMKEISSNGDIQTVDVMFPLHPVLLYTNPDILRYLLDPLLINQEAGYWPYEFSIHDLGTFPNATGKSNLPVKRSQRCWQLSSF